MLYSCSSRLSTPTFGISHSLRFESACFFNPRRKTIYSFGVSECLYVCVPEPERVLTTPHRLLFQSFSIYWPRTNFPNLGMWSLWLKSLRSLSQFPSLISIFYPIIYLKFGNSSATLVDRFLPRAFSFVSKHYYSEKKRLPSHRFLSARLKLPHPFVRQHEAIVSRYCKCSVSAR